MQRTVTDVERYHWLGDKTEEKKTELSHERIPERGVSVHGIFLQMRESRSGKRGKDRYAYRNKT
ncbi:MAG: hypothetical protein SO016_01085 [Lachnospiraceae bacterium]|nr:hypothetical protein [Lachnospiraceae bacterium]